MPTPSSSLGGCHRKWFVAQQRPLLVTRCIVVIQETREQRLTQYPEEADTPPVLVSPP